MDFAAELTAALGAEVQDADEETFVLFSQPAASRDLGFVDPRAPAVQVRVAGRDLTVHQSPGLLASRRAGGTTGAGPFLLLFREGNQARAQREKRG
ncbi:hypothetical protein CDD83_1300 [Cordyceps sp. RAO-2017]|nr:hypothetical protein CDD83_1300 [Cordyceps sp. RAO-2017]